MEQLELEIWADIEGYGGLYQISNFGRVKSLYRIVEHKYKNQQVVLEKLLQIYLTKNGYLRTALSINGNKKWIFVHRLVGIHFVPNPENKPQINHKNGIKLYNYYKNLEWVTSLENMRHGFDNDLFPRGDNHYLSKLTKEDVIKIRNSGKSKKICKKFAEIHNVHIRTIQRIVAYKSYKNIPKWS